MFDSKKISLNQINISLKQINFSIFWNMLSHLYFSITVFLFKSIFNVIIWIFFYLLKYTTAPIFFNHYLSIIWIDRWRIDSDKRISIKKSRRVIRSFGFVLLYSTTPIFLYPYASIHVYSSTNQFSNFLSL